MMSTCKTLLLALAGGALLVTPSLAAPVKIAEIPGVDAVLGAAEKFRLVELLDGFVRKPQPEVLTSDIAAANKFNTSYSLHDRTRTFLKVQDGCDYSCSFCTIPLARGNSRSDGSAPETITSTSPGKIRWGFSM